MPFEFILAEAFYCKNSMLEYNGQSPYQAVLGKHPKLLNILPAEGTSIAEVDDQGLQYDEPGILSHNVRLRLSGLRAIVEETARSRFEAAERYRGHGTKEGKNVAVGQMVDIYRDNQNKSIAGWRGPANFSNLNSTLKVNSSN